MHLEIMESTLEAHEAELNTKGYRPKLPTIDEFVLHKGHTYATCVMNLESEELLWFGEGRNKEAFEKFFEETNPSFLADVMVLVMDMNASYHILVKQHLPQAEIVYDRYHMQAQFRKDVLGVVRLSEARVHKERSRAVSDALPSADTCDRKRLKEEAKHEQQQYSQIKKLRWTLPAKAESLSDVKAAHLSDILQTHSDLAICYAMKEEMSALFEVRDSEKTEIGWKKWFASAKESRIPALVRCTCLSTLSPLLFILHSIAKKIFNSSSVSLFNRTSNINQLLLLFRIKTLINLHQFTCAFLIRQRICNVCLASKKICRRYIKECCNLVNILQV